MKLSPVSPAPCKPTRIGTTPFCIFVTADCGTYNWYERATPSIFTFLEKSPAGPMGPRPPSSIDDPPSGSTMPPSSDGIGMPASACDCGPCIGEGSLLAAHPAINQARGKTLPPFMPDSWRAGAGQDLPSLPP